MRRLSMGLPRHFPAVGSGGGDGAFSRIMQGLAAEAAARKTVMIDATYLKAHRTASGLAVKQGGAAAPSRAREAG